eukprot:jgi/Undpi1/1516/HiC_scaffold_11.g04906.m1
MYGQTQNLPNKIARKLRFGKAKNKPATTVPTARVTGNVTKQIVFTGVAGKRGLVLEIDTGNMEPDVEQAQLDRWIEAGSLRLSSRNNSNCSNPWESTPRRASTTTPPATEPKGGALSRWLPILSPPASPRPATTDGASFRKSGDGGVSGGGRRDGGGDRRRKSSALAGIGAKLSAFVRPPAIDTSNIFGSLGPLSPSPRPKQSVAVPPPLGDCCGERYGGGNRGSSMDRSRQILSKDRAVGAAAVVMGMGNRTPTGFSSSPCAHGRVPAVSPSDSRGGGGDSRKERMLPYRQPVAYPTTTTTTADPGEARGISSPRARGGFTRRGSGSGEIGIGFYGSSDVARWASGKPFVDVRRRNGAGRGAGGRKSLGGPRWGAGKNVNTRWNAGAVVSQRGGGPAHTGHHVPRALASEKTVSHNGGLSVPPAHGNSNRERFSGGKLARSKPLKPRDPSSRRGLTRATARRLSTLEATRPDVGGGTAAESEHCISSGTDSSDDEQSIRNRGSGRGNGNGTSTTGSTGVKGGTPTIGSLGVKAGRRPSSRKNLRMPEQQLDSWMSAAPEATREEFSASTAVSAAKRMSLEARDARFNAGSNVPSRS